MKYSIILISLLIATAVNAESVVVSILGGYDESSISLEPNQKARLEVFLQSFGEPLDGYSVVLYRDGDQRELKRIVSNSSGEMFFKGLPPGHYTVALMRPSRGARAASMVKIGDVRLTVLDGN